MSLGRTIISALLAFWMPLCCCQIGAIAGTGAPCCASDAPRSASHGSASCCAPARETARPCCAPAPKPVQSCCAATQTRASTPEAMDCGTDDEGCCGAGTDTPAGESCTCCSTKAPAPTQESIDDLLPLHRALCAVHSWTALALVHDAGAMGFAASEAPPPHWAGGALPWPAARQSDRCAQLSVRTT